MTVGENTPVWLIFQFHCQKNVAFYKEIAGVLCAFMQTGSGRRALFNYIVSLFKQLEQQQQQNLFLFRSFLVISEKVLI